MIAYPGLIYTAMAYIKLITGSIKCIPGFRLYGVQLLFIHKQQPVWQGGQTQEAPHFKTANLYKCLDIIIAVSWLLSSLRCYYNVWWVIFSDRETGAARNSLEYQAAGNAAAAALISKTDRQNRRPVRFSYRGIETSPNQTQLLPF